LGGGRTRRGYLRKFKVLDKEKRKEREEGKRKLARRGKKGDNGKKGPTKIKERRGAGRR
jgi:hypothetical protein